MGGMNEDTTYRVVRTRHGAPLWAAIVRLRLEVYVDEQKVPIEEELDAHDETAVHFAVLTGDAVVGTIRVVMAAGEAKIGRLAIAAGHRRRGLARRLMRAGIDESTESGAPHIILDAQTWVTSLYAGFGFEEEGEVFMDCGIPHIRMVLELGEQRE